jgi:hypothetical protein
MAFRRFMTGMGANNGLMFTAQMSDDAPMSLSHLIRRLLGRRGAPSTLQMPYRAAVRPPAMWGQAESVWSSLRQWLTNGSGTQPHHIRVLDSARADFGVALHGLDSDSANDLRQRAVHARSLRELWHLRAELYSVIARHLSQSEADKRLCGVNRHFPADAHGIGSHAAGTRNGQNQSV